MDVPLTRDFFDAGILFVAALGLVAALLGAMGPSDPLAPRSRSALAFFQALVGIAVATAIATWVSGEPWGAAAALLASLLVLADLALHLPRLSVAGLLQTALAPLALVVGLPWTFMLAYEAGASPVLLGLVVAGGIVALPLTAIAFAGGIARNALFTHRRWERPNRPLPGTSGPRPKVSIQLPCYAEPPALVIATIDRLLALDYDNYEILVCDNNTRDERLWRPIEAYCAAVNRRLGEERVRFFHVAPLPGAKAGALNHLLPLMARDAELIAVIDADYFAEPDFLKRLAGYFSDPAIGYLQTPHDYRRWQDDRYLRMCYWEYLPANKVELPGVAEYGAGYTIGTMCLIRTAALRAAGGWAEWCLTEDSEVSVRLRAIGYEGLYVRDTFGRGLIPDTFADYKKQRFRWTAGPVQQLRRYWRLYLPREIAAESALNGWSRLLELERGLSPLLGVAGSVLGVIAAIVIAGAGANGALPAISMPQEAWLALALGTAAALVRRWQLYRLSGCTRISEMVEGEIARASLAWVQMVGAVAGLSTRPIAWRRTPKFQAAGSGWQALGVTLPETLLGTALGALAGWQIALWTTGNSDLLLVSAIGMGSFALQLLAAPLMAWLGERRLSAPVVASATAAPPRLLTTAGAGPQREA